MATLKAADPPCCGVQIRARSLAHPRGYKLAAGSKREIEFRLRKELEEPTRAAVSFTVRDGERGTGRVLLRRNDWLFPVLEITSTEVLVGRRPWIRLKLRCIPGAVKRRVCRGRAWLGSVRTWFGIHFPLTRTSHFRIGVGKERAVPIRLNRGPHREVMEHRRKHYRVVAVVLTQPSGIDEEEVGLRWGRGADRNF